MRTSPGAGAIIEDDEGNVFLVQVERRGMLRWELPTRIQRQRETIYLTLYNCINEESSASLSARIKRPVCFVLHRSFQKQHQFFGMFFECRKEGRGVRLTEYTSAELPEDTRQSIQDAKFIDWRCINRKEFHPQHLEILERWNERRDGPLFMVLTDADSDKDYYNGKSDVKSRCLESGMSLHFPTLATDYGHVFVSYSHRDVKLIEEIRGMFGVAQKAGEIEIWSDQQIDVGDTWLQKIHEAMERAQIALLLVSNNFLNSDFIMNTELPKLMDLRKHNGLRIIPIHKEFTLWNKTLLKDIQAANNPQKPLEVFKGIERNKEIHRIVLYIMEQIEATQTE